MPLFICESCGCVENTALCNYWTNHCVYKLPALCSECDPYTAEWHGAFPKRKPTEAEKAAIDEASFINYKKLQKLNRERPDG